jgi:hypothetical protein
MAEVLSVLDESLRTWLSAVHRTRLVWAALAVVAALVGLLLIAEIGPLRGCRPIPPSELPSGAPIGDPDEDVYAGGTQVTWGSGSDQIRQVIGPDFLDPSRPPISFVAVRGQPAAIFSIDAADGGSDLALSWQLGGCSYTVLLARGKSVDDAVMFAARY